MAKDPIVEGAIQSQYMKRMYDYMSNVQADLDKNNNVFQGKDWINSGEGVGLDTAIGAGMGALKMGIGVAGLFKDVPGFKEVKSNYIEDPKLAAAATMAMSDAVSNGDDYASRIRVRNQRAAQDLKTLGMSGGDRNFIAANTAAAADIENISNLAIDKQLEQEKQGAMGVAANLQQMALYDRLNKSRDELAVAEMNMKGNMWEAEQQSRNTAGASSLIASGMTDISGAAGNQVANDANKDLQKIMLMNAMAKIGEGGKQEVTTNSDNRNISIGGANGEPKAFDVLQALKQSSLFSDNTFNQENGNKAASLFDRFTDNASVSSEGNTFKEIAPRNFGGLNQPEVKWNEAAAKFIQPEQFISLKNQNSFTDSKKIVGYEQSSLMTEPNLEKNIEAFNKFGYNVQKERLAEIGNRNGQITNEIIKIIKNYAFEVPGKKTMKDENGVDYDATPDPQKWIDNIVKQYGPEYKTAIEYILGKTDKNPFK